MTHSFIVVQKALEEARNDLECDAQQKAEKAILKEKQKLQKEVDALKKGKQTAENEKRLADEARTVAEEARALADQEREQAEKEKEELQNEIEVNCDVTINELVKHFTKKQRSESDSESDEDGPPQPKRSRALASEFDEDGLLRKVPEYKGMNVNGLVLFKRVTEDIRKLIGKNEFFPLAKMYTGEEITTTQLGHVTVTTTSKNVPKPITNKSELFYLLYNFGQYYLQLYPEKASGFLEYLAFLTKVCDCFTVSALVELDNQICKEYVQHPQWNWDQTNAIIDKIYMYFAREADNMKSGGASTSSAGQGSTGSVPRGKQGKGKKQPFFQYQSPLAKVQPAATRQRFVSVAPPMPQYPGSFPGGPGFRPPMPPPMVPPPQPFYP